MKLLRRAIARTARFVYFIHLPAANLLGAAAFWFGIYTASHSHLMSGNYWIGCLGAGLGLVLWTLAEIEAYQPGRPLVVYDTPPSWMLRLWKLGQ